MSRVVVLSLIAIMLLLGACGGDADPTATPSGATTPAQPTGQPTAATGSTPGQTSATQPAQPAGPGAATAAPGQADAPTPPGPPAAPPTATSQPTPEPVRLSPEQLQQYQPNELGQIMLWEYHQIADEPEQFIRTPDQFRADLQWLYENNFYVINLHDMLDGHFDVPAGKKPVILTFDDSSAGQFRLIPLDNGQLAIDPDSAVGIMEDFFVQHPDFGRGGHFAVLPWQLFDWPDEPEQTPYGQDKLQWLLENGYELGNHTYEHANMSLLENGEIMYQLAEADIAIQELAPDADIRVITLPFGMFPPGGDDTLFRGFEYEGEWFEWDASLLVGANPTESPFSTEYDPYWIARIQAFDEELDRWKDVIAENPGILYVSDGNPETVTVPIDLHPWLVGTLDEAKLGGRELIRY
jgi:peptidoglycan/xylan/chitin deacetylase (PgdA/CDA1 family)